MGYFIKYPCTCTTGCETCGKGKRKVYVCTLKCEYCEGCLDRRLLNVGLCECDDSEICRCKDPYFILWTPAVKKALDRNNERDHLNELIACAKQSGEKSGMWVIGKVPKSLKSSFSAVIMKGLEYCPWHIVENWDCGWKNAYWPSIDYDFIPFRLYVPDFGDHANVMVVLDMVKKFMREAKVPPQTIYFKPTYFTRLRDLKKSVIKATYLIKEEVTKEWIDSDPT